MARRTGLVVAGALVVAVAAGCGAATGNDGNGTSGSVSVSRQAADPAALVGLWRVDGADGEERDAVLRLDDQGLTLWRDCGSLSGGWAADASGLFVGHVFGAGDGCLSGTVPDDLTPGWLRRVTSFGSDAKTPVLRDRDGQTVARLLPGGRPSLGPDDDTSLGEPPVPGDRVRAARVPAAPLPAGLEPADRAGLTGRWLPAGKRHGTGDDAPHLAVEDDGRWQGSDGCNGQSGGWTVGPDGAFLATVGPQTLIGCDGVDVGGWVSRAARAGLDGRTLVLLDRSGKELGRLVPDAS